MAPRPSASLLIKVPFILPLTSPATKIAEPLLPLLLIKVPFTLPEIPPLSIYIAPPYDDAVLLIKIPFKLPEIPPLTT